MPSFKFVSKENRDKFCRENRGYRKRSIRNQVLSPDYVSDYEGKRVDNGFGGQEPRYFGVLYIAEK